MFLAQSLRCCGPIDRLVEPEAPVAALRHESAAFLSLPDKSRYLGDILVTHPKRAALGCDFAHWDSRPAGSGIHQVSFELRDFVPLQVVVVSPCHLREVLKDLRDAVRQASAHDSTV